MKYFLTITIVLSLLSCNNQKASSTEHFAIITFNSNGEGINHQARSNLISLLKGSYPKLNYTVKTIGREGERLFCINYSTIPKHQHTTFIKELNELFLNDNSVQVNTQSNCP